jgi:hypothetical protein
MKPLRLGRQTLIFSAFAVAAIAAQAQKLAPGLWDNAITMKSGHPQHQEAMAKAQAALASMPADQRKMMQDMMAKQGVAMGAKPNAVQVCITPEMAERGELPQKDGRCTHKTLQRSGSTVKYSFTCDGSPPTSGEGEYTLTSDKAYSGRNVITTTVQGKPERMEMTMSGNWVAADCGALKPRK